jgi:Ni,Fe-hydrogenase maturation factor
MNQLGLKPKDVIIFGIEPKEIDWGLEPSEELEHSIPDIVKLVLEEIKRC